MRDLRGIRSIPLDDRHRELLVARRRELGISQAKLAGGVGVTALTVHNLETGKSQPTPKLLDKLCQVLGLEYDVAIYVHLRPAKESKPSTKSKPASKRKTP